MARPEKRAKADIDLIFHALADPTRRRMIEALTDRPYALSALAEPFGMTLTAVSQHLRILEQAGLVRSEKLGRVRSCRIEAAGLAVLQAWVSDRRSLWERRLDRLGDILDEPG
ncbi:ArsR/SmtB family transcription factor [Sphingomonas sp.]|uniref:ArsR/SmtB family transcription factor n=1 Tax=Sphingomonas sp. TaxID=28214 RepID=UPI003B3B8459